MRRPDEMTTAECLDVVHQLRDLGVREVTLIGGEAFLRKDWTQIVQAVSDSGMQCGMQTGAWHLAEEQVRQAKDAGLVACGVSIDGLAELHDRLRGRSGSFDAAVDALHRLNEAGIRTSVNTQITAPVIVQLRDLLDVLASAGVRNWQVQLTVAMGRAADNHHLLIQPFQLLELMPILAEIYTAGVARGVLLQPGNNIGYFGPFEHLLRGSGDSGVHWTGCFAGRNVMGIEADGTVKGCPSLPTSSYTGGNVRDLALSDIWSSTPELSFARNDRTAQLWGFCSGCYYADVCQAGCTWTSHSLLGKPGNNPYCHYRALELDKQGLRERVVPRVGAPGKPFDHGEFEIVCESNGHPASIAGASIGPTAPAADGDRNLMLCHGCRYYVYRGTAVCPHCGADVVAAQRQYDRQLAKAEQAAKRLVVALDELPKR
jgi:radical SAM protein with 4Fe4S-binding SPASM domain